MDLNLFQVVGELYTEVYALRRQNEELKEALRAAQDTPQEPQETPTPVATVDALPQE